METPKLNTKISNPHIYVLSRLYFVTEILAVSVEHCKQHSWNLYVPRRGWVYYCKASAVVFLAKLH